MSTLGRVASARLFVTLVAFTIVAVAYATVIALNYDPYRPAAAGNAVHKPLYLALAALALFAYLRTHFCHPGPASQWHIHRPDLIHPNAIPDPENPPYPNRCTRCDAPKHQRVHHCTACDICVLRFDHHCPWLGTCIGLLNAKFFLQFLLFTTLLAAYTVYIQTVFLIHCRAVAVDEHLIFVVAFATPLCLAISVATFFGVGGLFIWNCYLAAINQTALENFRVSSNQPVVDYFDTIPSNLRHLLGWNPCLWLLPLRQSRAPPSKSKG